MPAGPLAAPGVALGRPAAFSTPAGLAQDASFWGLPAGIAPWLLGAATGSATGNPRSFPLAPIATMQPGDTVLVIVGVNNTSLALTGCTDSQGNQYALAGGFNNASPEAYFWHSQGNIGGSGGGPTAVLGPADTIQIANGGTAGNMTVLVFCVPGAMPLDTWTAALQTNNAMFGTSNPVTPAAALELIVLGILNQPSGGAPVLPPPGPPGPGYVLDFSAATGGQLTETFATLQSPPAGVAQTARWTLGPTIASSRAVQWAFRPPPQPPRVIQQSAPVRIRGAGPVALTLPGPTGTGNTVVVCTGTNGTTGNPLVSGITLGGSADNFAKAAQLASASRNDSEIWYDPAAASGQTAVSVSYAGGTGTLDEFAIAYEVAGVLAAGPAATAEAGPGTSWQVGPAAALGQPAGIAFGSVVNTASVVPVPGDQVNWTTIWNEAGTYAHLTGYDYLSYPAAASAAVFAGTVPGGQYTGAVATFYPGTAPTAVPLADQAAAAEQLTAAAAVPLADAAAGADALAASAAVPLADAAGAADSLSVQVSVPLAEAAGAADSVAVQAAVPLAEAAGAADASQVSVAVSLADTAGAADQIGVQAGAAPQLADAAGAVDALTVVVSLPLADRAGAADAISPAAAVSLADAGSAVEALDTSQRGIALADTAGAADQVQVSAAVPLAESGAAADTSAVSAAVPLTDRGAAAEQLGVSAAIPVGDTAAASDAVTSAVAATLADQAAGTDAISTVQGAALALAEAAAAVEQLIVTAVTGLADTAGAAEQLAVQAGTALADAAGAADSIQVTVSGQAVGLADAAGAADSLSVSVSVPLAEAGAAADALAPPPAVHAVLADAAGVTDALSASVQTFSHDTAAASDILAIGRQITLSDVAAAADTLIVTEPPAGPQPVFTAAPWPARWAAEPDPPALQVAPERSRWQAGVQPPRWAAAAVPARWRVMAEFEPIAAISVENVNVVWTSDLGGSVVDPTAGPMPVQFAFPASSGDTDHPAHPSAWLPGTWLMPLSGGYKGFIAQCPAGPVVDGGLVQLAAGAYDVWSEVDTGTEKVRKFVGVQEVY